MRASMSQASGAAAYREAWNTLPRSPAAITSRRALCPQRLICLARSARPVEAVLQPPRRDQFALGRRIDKALTSENVANPSGGTPLTARAAPDRLPSLSRPAGAPLPPACVGTGCPVASRSSSRQRRDARQTTSPSRSQENRTTRLCSGGRTQTTARVRWLRLAWRQCE